MTLQMCIRDRRKKQNRPLGKHLIPRHHSYKNQQPDSKINEINEGGGDWNDQPWKVDFLNQAAFGHHAQCAAFQAPRKQGPWQKGSECEEWIRQSIRRHFCQVAEYKGEDQRAEQRLHEGPASPNSGLSIAGFEIPPCEKVQQFPCSPQFTPSHLDITRAGFYYCLLYTSRCV